MQFCVCPLHLKLMFVLVQGGSLADARRRRAAIGADEETDEGSDDELASSSSSESSDEEHDAATQHIDIKAMEEVSDGEGKEDLQRYQQQKLLRESQVALCFFGLGQCLQTFQASEGLSWKCSSFKIGRKGMISPEQKGLVDLLCQRVWVKKLKLSFSKNYMCLSCRMRKRWPWI